MPDGRAGSGSTPVQGDANQGWIPPGPPGPSQAGLAVSLPAGVDVSSTGPLVPLSVACCCLKGADGSWSGAAGRSRSSVPWGSRIQVLDGLAGGGAMVLDCAQPRGSDAGTSSRARACAVGSAGGASRENRRPTDVDAVGFASGASREN